MNLVKLRVGLLIVSALLFVAICIMSFLAYSNIEKSIKASERLASSQDLLRSLREAMDHISDMERIQKNYMITGEDSYIGEYDSTLKLISVDTLNIISVSLKDHKQYEVPLTQIIKLISSRLQQGDSAMALTKAGDEDGAAELMHTLRGRKYLDSLLIIERKLENNEDDILGESQMKDKLASGSTAKWFLSFATLLLLVLAFFLVLIFSNLRKNEIFMSRFNEELNRQVELAEKDLKHSNEKLRKLNNHLQVVREEERTRIAREVHDELGQKLTVIKLGISVLNKRLGSDPSVKETLEELLTMVRDTMQAVKRISSDLRPASLDELGLKAAIEWQLEEFSRNTGIKSDIIFSIGELAIPDETAVSLFRIFQESLTNITRHAHATEVVVKFMHMNDTLELLVEDNGKGFYADQAEEKQSLGLLGMRERAAAVNGVLEIDSILGKGTSIKVVVPFPS